MAVCCGNFEKSENRVRCRPVVGIQGKYGLFAPIISCPFSNPSTMTMEIDDRQWIDEVLKNTPGYESEVFAKFAGRLMAFARTRLPKDLCGRVDEEDIIQSVFMSFFRRNEEGQFTFDDELDVWSLLAAMTYRKVVNAIEFHHRDRRNTAKEIKSSSSSYTTTSDLIDRGPTPEDFNIMVDYMHWMLEKFSPTQQKILQARLEGCSIAEIAESVGVSHRTVKRTLAKARDVASSRMQEEA